MTAMIARKTLRPRRWAVGGMWLTLVLAGGCRDRAASGGSLAPAGNLAEASATAALAGTVFGRIQIIGPLPSEPAVPLPASVTKLCGERLEAKTVVVGPDQGLQDAVVWLEAAAVPRDGREGSQTAVAPDTVVLDQRRCVYRPRVVTARAGDILEVRNSDDLLHNVRTGEGAKTWFNLAMPFAGMNTRKVLPPKPATIAVGCDVHSWMRAWVKSFDHPWFAQSDADGRFRIENVPPGKKRLHVWHERFPERTVEVEITSGQSSALDLEWNARELRSP